MKQYVVGVDVGGTSAKIGLFLPDGTLVEKWEVPTGLNKGGAETLSDIAQAIRLKLSARDLSLSDLAGVGLDAPGPVLPDGSVSDFANLNWGAINIRDTLSGFLDGATVRVGNDANVAALGELWMGAGRGYHSLVMVTLGTGVGGGVVINETILAGANGAAGEIGHLLVNRDETETCGCGNRGCLEQYASATGLTRVARQLLAQKKDLSSPLRAIASFDAKDIFDAAKENDAIALEATQIMCRYLGEALANVAAVVDPEIIVIGGGVSKAGDFLLDAVRRYYEPAAFFAVKNARLALAALGNDGGMYGGARMALS